MRRFRSTVVRVAEGCVYDPDERALMVAPLAEVLAAVCKAHERAEADPVDVDTTATWRPGAP